MWWALHHYLKSNASLANINYSKKQIKATQAGLTVIGLVTLTLLLFFFLGLPSRQQFLAHLRTVTLLEDSHPHITNLTHVWHDDSITGEFHLSSNLTAPVFKMQLLGPQILRLPFDNTALGTFTARYDLLPSGNYTAELIMLFESFVISNVSQITMKRPKPLTNYTFTVNAHPKQRSASITSHDDDEEELDQSHELPYCDGYIPLNGRWHVHNPQLIPPLSTAGYNGEYVANQTVWNDLIFKNLVLDYKPRTDIPVQLEYVPDRCRVVDYSRNITAMKSCVSNQTICMWGDSHIRTLHNTLAAWESGEYTAFNKEPAVSPFSTYYLKQFGGFEENVESLFANNKCNHVFFNFGLWPASHIGNYPWSPKQYEIYAEADIAWLAELQTKYPHVTVWWVTTDPLAYLSNLFAAPSKDWRYEPLLEEYNLRANEIARRYQIPIIDTWTSGHVLNKLTIDGSHYKGIVEWTYANMVLTAMCNKN
jgi:hypothetical protein